MPRREIKVVCRNPEFWEEVRANPPPALFELVKALAVRQAILDAEAIARGEDPFQAKDPPVPAKKPRRRKAEAEAKK